MQEPHTSDSLSDKLPGFQRPRKNLPPLSPWRRREGDETLPIIFGWNAFYSTSGTRERDGGRRWGEGGLVGSSIPPSEKKNSSLSLVSRKKKPMHSLRRYHALRHAHRQTLVPPEGLDLGVDLPRKPRYKEREGDAHYKVQ